MPYSRRARIRKGAVVTSVKPCQTDKLDTTDFHDYALTNSRPSQLHT